MAVEALERDSYFHLVNPGVGCQELKVEAEAPWLKYGFVHLGSSPSSAMRRRCVSAEPRPSGEAEDIAFVRYVATFHFGGVGSLTRPKSSSSGEVNRNSSPHDGLELDKAEWPAQHGEFRTLAAGTKASGVAAVPCSPSGLRADAPVFVPPVFVPQPTVCPVLLSASPASLNVANAIGAGQLLSLPPPPLAPAPSPAPVVSSPPPWWVCFEAPGTPQPDVSQVEAALTAPAHRVVEPRRHLPVSGGCADNGMDVHGSPDQQAEASKLMHAILGSERAGYDDATECVSLASRGSSSSTIAPPSVEEDVHPPPRPPSPRSRPGLAVAVATKGGQTSSQRDHAHGASASRLQANGHGRAHRRKGTNSHGVHATGVRVWRPKGSS